MLVAAPKGTTTTVVTTTTIRTIKTKSKDL
jgi:hypothetical protein